MMTQVSQRAGDAVVTPSRVLAGKPNHQFLHLGGNTGSARIATGLGTIKLAGDEPPVPGEDGVWFGHAGHLLQSFAPESLADLRKRASLRIRQAQPGWQMRPQDSILRRQVLVLEEQFLVHQPRYKRQETSALIALHANCPSSQISDSRAVRVFWPFGNSSPAVQMISGSQIGAATANF